MNKFKFLLLIIIASMFFLQINSSFEDRLFERIATRTVGEFSNTDLSSKNPHLQNLIKDAKEQNLTDIEKLIKLNELTHVLLGPPRKILFLPESEEAKGILDKHLHSSMISLLGGYACYMHSQVFGRLAHSLGLEYQNFSMLYNGKNHNVAEVKVNDKWVVFDPLFNHVFKDNNGNIVGKDEIAKNWDLYSKQVGNACMFERSDYIYDMDYNYTDINRQISFISEIKHSILFMWSKVLGYESADKIKDYMLMNRYFYWQILISTIFIFLNIFSFINFLVIRKLQK